MNWDEFKVNKSGPATLHAQLSSFIENAIRQGELLPGDRIPSMAELARRLKVNKVTVVRAFGELEQKGRTVSKVGKGTFVAGQPEAAPSADAALSATVAQLRENYLTGIDQLLSAQTPPGGIDLRPGVPPHDGVAPDLLASLTAEVTRESDRLFTYAHHGLPELIDAICDWLGERGYRVQRDQILVTNGSQQAVALIASWAMRDRRQVYCETPTYVGLPRIFSLSGHHLKSLPWDDEGPRADAVAGIPDGPPSLLYCCPEFQNPTGQCISRARREQISEAAGRKNMVVVVDDIFRDMRFAGKELPSLYETLPAARRVLVGSFSKSFMPGLRAGFLIADRPLKEAFSSIKKYMDLGSPTLTQAIMARFLRSGGYRDHLTKMRPFYRKRCKAALAALGSQMPDGVTFTRPQGGFQLWVQLPPGYSSVRIYLAALERGVAISPGPAHDMDGRYMNCFRIGYGQATPARITQGITTLAAVVRETFAQGPEEPTATGL